MNENGIREQDNRLELSAIKHYSVKQYFFYSPSYIIRC